MSGEQDGACFTDEYMMGYYKVVPCSRKYAHDWASCPCKHEGERASRRNLDQHPYVSIACHYAKQRAECPLGARCTHAHNMFEYWLHPQRFKTELCQFGPKCNRTVCFYAHSMDDLRPLDPSLPPPEPCWSSGAILSKASRHQQRQAQLQAHARALGPRMLSGGPPPTTRMTSRPGQSSSGGAGLRPPASGMAVSPQQPPQPQPQQVFVVNALPACDTPKTPSFSPAMQHAHYTQQQPQQQQQVVVLQTGQGMSSTAAPGGYATITLPVSSAGLPVSAGGIQGAVVVQAQQAPQPQPQPVVQYTMPSSTQQVLQCNMPGSNQPTYWVQVPDPSMVNSTTVVNSASAPMAGGQLVQIELPAANIAPGSSSLPAQTFVLDGGYVLQQQQQAHAAQGMVSLQALSEPPPAGMVQVGVLDSTIPGLMSAGGPLAMSNGLQQHSSSGGSWQFMYPPSTHSMLMDLQNMGFG